MKKLLFLLICLPLSVLTMFGQVRDGELIEKDYKAAVSASDYDKILKLCEEYFDSWNVWQSDFGYKTLIEGAGQGVTMGDGRNAVRFKDKLYYYYAGTKMINSFITISNRMVSAHLGKNDTIAALDHLNDVLGDKTAFHITRHASRLFFRRARIYWEQGEFEKAVKDYEIIYTRQRDRQNVMLDNMKKDILLKDILANYYLKNNDYDNTSRILRLWLNEDGGAKMSAKDYATLGFTYYKGSDTANTVKYYNEATKLEPQIDIEPEVVGVIVAYVSELETKKKEEEQRLKKIEDETEARRVANIKGAQIGDRLLYVEEFTWTGGWSRTIVKFTMFVNCFVERIEGDRYQLRVGDVSSSNSERYEAPEINGVKVSKGDMIWVRPVNDKKWLFVVGE